MRGPGPKWHAKHEAALLSAAGAQPGPNSKTEHELHFGIWAVPATAVVLLGFVAIITLT
jgi:hypothetical protein